MNEQNNLSQHLDKNIIYLFLFVFFIATSIVAFKYNKYAPCNEVMFITNAKEYREGELIKFIDNTEDAIEWKWEFGDSTETSTNKDPLHVFKKPGEYIVRLTINDICEKEELITIKEKEAIIDSTRVPQFHLPANIIVGYTLKVSDKTPNAIKWEWRFGETSSVNSTSRYAKYAYKTPGLKTVSLIVNGDIEHMAKRKINVLPITTTKTRIKQIRRNRGIDWNIKDKPIEETVKDENGDGKEKPKVVPYISESLFSKNLVLVSKNQMSPKQFSEYFCGDINKKVVVNGKNSTFLVFCEKIKGKKIKLKRLSIYRDKGSNCIKTMTIDYKKKGFWNNILGSD